MVEEKLWTRVQQRRLRLRAREEGRGRGGGGVPLIGYFVFFFPLSDGNNVENSFMRVFVLSSIGNYSGGRGETGRDMRYLETKKKKQIRQLIFVSTNVLI